MMMDLCSTVGTQYVHLQRRNVILSIHSEKSRQQYQMRNAFIGSNHVEIEPDTFYVAVALTECISGKIANTNHDEIVADE